MNYSNWLYGVVLAISVLSQGVLAMSPDDYLATASLDRISGRHSVSDHGLSLSDYESISTFSGELKWSYPLVDLSVGTMNYGLNLTYSSNYESPGVICDTVAGSFGLRFICPEYMGLDNKLNAGTFGIFLGYLYRPIIDNPDNVNAKWTEWPNRDFRSWMYADSSGNTSVLGTYQLKAHDGQAETVWAPPHNGSTFYSTDTSNLRLRLRDVAGGDGRQQAWLEYPNGQVRIFDTIDSLDEADPDFCPLATLAINDCFRLTLILDAVAAASFEAVFLAPDYAVGDVPSSGNYVAISYADNAQGRRVVSLTDSEAQVTTIQFHKRAYFAEQHRRTEVGTRANMRSAHSLTLPDGATYTFDYLDNQQVQRSCPPLGNSAGQIYSSLGVPEHYYLVRQLSTLTLPDGTSWSFTYHPASGGDCPLPNAGRLASVENPIGGKTEYEYGHWVAPMHCEFEDPASSSLDRDVGGPEPLPAFNPPSSPRRRWGRGIAEVTRSGVGVEPMTTRYASYLERETDLPGFDSSSIHAHHPAPTHSIAHPEGPGGTCWRPRWRGVVIDRPSSGVVWERQTYFFNTYVGGFDDDTRDQRWDPHLYGFAGRNDITRAFLDPLGDSDAGGTKVHLAKVVGTCRSGENGNCASVRDWGDVLSESYVKHQYFSGHGDGLKCFANDCGDTHDDLLTTKASDHRIQAVAVSPLLELTVHQCVKDNGAECTDQWTATQYRELDPFGRPRSVITEDNYLRSSGLRTTANQSFNGDLRSARLVAVAHDDTSLGSNVFSAYSVRMLDLPDSQLSAYPGTDIHNAFGQRTQAGALWLLDQATRRTVTEGGTSSVTDVCRDAYGRVIRARQYDDPAATPTPRAWDVLTETVFDDAQGGRVTDVKTYGGASHPHLPTSNNPCSSTAASLAPSLMQHISHTHTLDQRLLTTVTENVPTNGSANQDEPLTTTVTDVANDRPISATNQQGVTATTSYDAMGRVTRIDNGASRAEVAYVYSWVPRAGSDPNPDCTHPCVDIQVYADDEAVATYAGAVELDPLGRTVREWIDHASGELWSEAVYNGAGLITDITTNATTPESTQYTYDAHSRLGSVVYPDGRRVEFYYRGADRVDTQYDVAGDFLASIDTVRTRQITYSDPQGRVTLDERWEWPAQADQRKRLYFAVNTHSALGLATTKRLRDRLTDSQGEPIEASAPEQIRRYTRNGLGQLINESIPERADTSHTYTALGDVFMEVRDGTRTKQLYDRYGRLTNVYSACDAQNDNCTPYSAFVYDDRGQLTQAVRRNYLSGADQTFSGLTNQQLLVKDQYRYREDGFMSGHRTVLARPTNHGSQTLFSTQNYRFEYDGLGRLRAHESPRCVTCWERDGESAAKSYNFYQYDGLQLARASMSDRAVCDAHELGGVDLDYADTGLVSQLDFLDGAQVGSTQSFTRHPDGMALFAGWRSQSGGLTHYNSGAYQYDAAGNLRAIGSHSLFGYDPASRLIAAQVQGTGRTRSFAYDVFDNHLTAPSGSADYQVNINNNRVTQWDGHSITYNNHGAVIAIAGDTVHYDDLGQQTAWAGADYAATYLYDTQGHRVATEERMGAETVQTWTQRLPTSKTVVRSFARVTGPDPSQTTSYLRVADQLVALHQGNAASVRYFHNDHLGNPRVTLDREGNLQRLRHYWPFGESWDAVQDAHAGVGPQFGFTGYEEDGNGQTLYAMARSYQAGLGRFLRVDPIQDGWNRFAFVGNRPTVLTDPSGMNIASVALSIARMSAVKPVLARAASQQTSNRAALETLDLILGRSGWGMFTAGVVVDQKIDQAIDAGVSIDVHVGHIRIPLEGTPADLANSALDAVDGAATLTATGAGLAGLKAAVAAGILPEATLAVSSSPLMVASVGYGSYKLAKGGFELAEAAGINTPISAVRRNNDPFRWNPGADLIESFAGGLLSVAESFERNTGQLTEQEAAAAARLGASGRLPGNY